MTLRSTCTRESLAACLMIFCADLHFRVRLACKSAPTHDRASNHHAGDGCPFETLEQVLGFACVSIHCKHL